MASGDKRIGTSGDSLPFGTEVICVGPLLLTAATIFPVYVPLNMGYIRVKKVRSVTTVDTDAACTVTIKNTTTTMDGGSLVIGSGGGVADKDDCDIVDNAKARVDALDYIALCPDGVPTAGEAVFFIEYERCQ